MITNAIGPLFAFFFYFSVFPTGLEQDDSQGDRGGLPTTVCADRHNPTPEYSWEVVAGDILPQWRDGIATVSRGNDLYLIAGWKPRSFPEPFTATTNEIWRSEDRGVTWSFFAKAGFTPRHTFVCIDSTDGYVYVIGGDQYNDFAQRSEVWRSQNLRDWELVNHNSPFGNRMQLAGVEYKGDFYVGGGQALPDFRPGMEDFYISKDKGLTWTLLPGSPKHLGKNVVGTMAVFNDKIYQVSGGWYGGDSLATFTYHQTVFSTTDGINWSKENPLPIPGVQYPNTVVFDNKLWCIGGSSVTTGSRATSFNKNDVCAMDSSGKWTVVTPLKAGPPTHASSLIVSDSNLLLVMGNEVNGVFKLSRTN
jgi:hypothetical protein